MTSDPVLEKEEIPVLEEVSSDRKRFSFSDFQEEMRKIEWPSRSEALRSAGAVVTVMVFFVCVVFVLDLSLVKVFEILKR
jgi:preprotein translocase SecE subunit